MNCGRWVICFLLVAFSSFDVSPAAAFLNEDVDKCERPGNLTPQQTITHCDRALKLPDFPWVNRTNLQISRGYQRMLIGDLDGALSDFNEALKRDPKSADAYNGRSMILVQKGDIAQGIKDITRAIELMPGKARFRVGRADIYSEIGRFDDAKEDLDEALRLDPHSAQAYSSLATWFDRKGLPDQTINAARQALKYNPKWHPVYGILGMAYVKKGMLKEALSSFTKAVKLAPNFGLYRYMRGVILLEAGSIDAGFADLSTFNVETLPPMFRTDAYVMRGRAYMLKARYDIAIADLDRAIRMDPKNAEAYLARGRAHQGKNDYRRAAADYAAAKKLDPDSDLIRLHSGVLLLKVGRTDSALALLTRALESKSIPAESRIIGLRARGAARIAKGDHSSALRDFDEAIGLAPDDLALKVLRANSLIALHRFDEAIAGVAPLLEKKDISAEERTAVHYVRARAFAGKADYLSADKAFEAAFEAGLATSKMQFDYAVNLYRLQRFDGAIARFGAVIDDASAPARLRVAARLTRAGIHMRRSDRPKAVEDLKAAYEAVEENSPVGRRIGKLMWQVGMVREFQACSDSIQARNWDAAMRQCTSAIKSGELPGRLTGMAHYYRCYALNAEGRLQQALPDCTAGIDLRPNFIYARHLRGQINTRLGHTRAAVEDFSVALRLDPNHPTARIERGEAYRVLKQYDKAIADFTAQIDRGEDLPTAHHRRGVAYSEVGQFEAALADYDKAIALNPKVPEFYVNRAIAKAGLRRTEEAVRDFQAAIDAGHRAPYQMYFNMGLAFQRAGQRDKAIEFFEKSLKKAPDFTPARQALEKIR